MKIDFENGVILTRLILECLGMPTGVFGMMTEVFGAIKTIASDNIPDEKQKFICKLQDSVKAALNAENQDIADDVHELLCITFQQHFDKKELGTYYGNRDEWCQKLTAKHFSESQKNDDTCKHFRTALRQILDAVYENMELFEVDIKSATLDKLFTIEKMLALYADQQEIIKHLQKYKNSLVSYFDVTPLPPLQEYSSKLYYRYKGVGFYGREAQVAQIEEFIGGDERVRIWCIAGDGGVGKSKLAWYAGDALKNDCTPIWLDDAAFNTLLSIQDDNYAPCYAKPVLFICDYANSKKEQLLQLILHMRHMAYRSRFLLIERQPEWYAHFYEEQQEFSDYFWRESDEPVDALNLTKFPLDERACGYILEDYRKAAYPHAELSDEDKKRIINAAFALETNENHRKMRCLYLLLTADSFLQTGEFRHWNAAELVGRYLERSKQMLSKKYPMNVLNAAYRLLALATALDGLDLSKSYSKKIQADVNVVKNHFGKRKLRAFLSELSEAHEVEGLILPPLSPDIVGEYLFLLQYNDLMDGVKKWNKLLFESNYAKIVLIRCLNDWYGEETETLFLSLAKTHPAGTMKIICNALLGHWYGELPEQLLALLGKIYEQYPSVKTAAVYSHGIGHLFEFSKSKRRQALLETALGLADSLEGQEDADTANVLNNIGLMFKKMGDSELALEYFQKVLEIDKKCLDKHDFSLATSYNNIGLVYKDLNKYTEALGYLQKALEIDEKDLDKHDSSLAITYNNIGSVYQALKQYTEALKYRQKALEIAEKVFEKKHPHLAATYNNIGTVYLDLKDYPTALTYFEQSFAIYAFLEHYRAEDTMKCIVAAITLLPKEEQPKAKEKLFEIPKAQEMFITT